MWYRLKISTEGNVAVGIDIGSSDLKAAVVRRRGDGFELCEYGTRPLPTADALTGEIRQLVAGLKHFHRRAHVTVSCRSATVCRVELPRAPIADARRALRLNSLGYLNRDFSDCHLDVAEVPGVGTGKTMHLLVAGAKKEEIARLLAALVAARVEVETLELAPLSIINAFRTTRTAAELREPALLVDIGAHFTSMTVVADGQPVVTRITPLGKQQVGAEMGNLVIASQPERATETTLARELRATVDYFERQHDRHIRRAFACGGPACLPQLLTHLSEETGLPIERWNPIESFETSHFNGESPRLFALAPMLTAAVGAATARL